MPSIGMMLLLNFGERDYIAPFAETAWRICDLRGRKRTALVILRTERGYFERVIESDLWHVIESGLTCDITPRGRLSGHS